jgi:hypothetical protein
MEKFKRLAVFDMDGTLIDTPTKETGVITYKEKTGQEWPHQGWWGRGETLDMDIFDMEMVPSVREAYEIERAKPDTMVIMLTGRIPRLRHLVEAILNKFDFKFDSYNYNMGGPTDVSKIKTITEILDKHKSIAEVKMWDDRTDHIQIFNDWGRQQIKSGRLQDFHIEHVILENPHHK